jgi:hypothetical protein
VGVGHVLANDRKEGFNVGCEGASHVLRDLLHESKSTGFLDQGLGLHTDALFAESFDLYVEALVLTSRNICVFDLEINFKIGIIDKLGQ